MKRSFPPVVAPDTAVLVLGSLPGEESLARQRYYAHPRNQFWRLAGAVIERDLVSLDYEDRINALLRHRIGLWDVVASAEREGSLDASIRNHSPNALADLTDGLPHLKAVAFNGGTSARIGAKALAGTARFERVPLPSSSPAYTLPFHRKCAAWMALRDFL